MNGRRMGRLKGEAHLPPRCLPDLSVLATADARRNSEPAVNPVCWRERARFSTRGSLGFLPLVEETARQSLTSGR